MAPIPTFESRKYQLEMLEESLRRNIIIALDTGAGKTHIAVLRMKHEIERESCKVCASLLHAMFTTCQCQSCLRIAKSPIHTGLLVPRADSRARAAAAGSCRSPPPRFRRTHFWRERTGPVEGSGAVAPGAEHAPYRRQHSRRPPQRTPPWLHPPWGRCRFTCVR